MSSPVSPSPLESPFIKIPFLYVKEAEIPSIFGSEKTQNQIFYYLNNYLFFLKN